MIRNRRPKKEPGKPSKVKAVPQTAKASRLSAFETLNRMNPAELLRLIRNSRCALAIIPASCGFQFWA